MSNNGHGEAIPSRPIAPTIVIGLGGLGREVIFRTRRRLYERYRQTSVPVVSFLWLDHNTDVDPTPELPARLARKVALTADDRIALDLQTAELETLLASPEAVGGDESWLRPELLARTPGAVRSRLMGRVAMHVKADTIKARVKALAAEMSTPAAQKAADEIGFPATAEPIQVIIVTSLAGGLGSGAVATLAASVREALPEANIRGVLFLSGLFMAHDVSRRTMAMANGWAACRELHAAQKVDTPPFDAMYLVDRENADGNRPIDPLEPLEMVAETLALEFSRSRTASAIRGLRYASATGDGFASFGLATMAPGGGRLRSAVAYLLGAELLERWASGRARPDAERCGLPDGWPEAALAEAATDLREEFETYDIPPVEERNQALPAPMDMRPLLLTHLREEFSLPADASDPDIFAAVSAAVKMPTPPEGHDPWERFMDLLEIFCLKTCHYFDRRMAGEDAVFDDPQRAESLTRFRSWSEPWAPFEAGAVPEDGMRTLVGSGMPSEAPLIRALGGPVITYHPGTILRYRETVGLPATAFATLRACRLAYADFAAKAGDDLGHRHTVADFDALPDPLA